MKTDSRKRLLIFRSPPVLRWSVRAYALLCLAMLSWPALAHDVVGVPAQSTRGFAFQEQYSPNSMSIPLIASGPDQASKDPGLAGQARSEKAGSTSLNRLLELSGDPEYGEYLAGECLTCHQPDSEGKGIPNIFGLSSERLKTALDAYRLKQRSSEIMQAVAASLGDEEIAALAKYFEKSSTQP